MKLRNQIFLLLIVSALAVFVGQSFEDTLRQFIPEQRVFRSVVNKKASGLSALFAIAERSGLPCRMWLWPYRRLAQTRGLLYVVQPRQSWTQGEVEDILSWVEKGNQLVYFDSFFRSQDNLSRRTGSRSGKKIVNNALVRKLGLSLQWLDNDKVVYDRRLPEMAHVKKLLLKAEVKLIGGQPLVACNDGAYIVAVKHGSGRVLLGTMPEFCANVKLGQASNYDNFQFMVNCLCTTGGAVLFDEYCHGIKGIANVFVFFSRRLPGLICFQLLIMVLLAELGGGQRFGALKTLKSKRQISDLAYVSGLANVYKRAQANPVALEIIVGFWKTKLCRQFGLSARASTPEILQRAEEEAKAVSDGVNIPPKRGYVYRANGKGPANSDELARFFRDYEAALSRGEISKSGLIHLIDQCDTFTK